jgi:hypothetical protein
MLCEPQPSRREDFAEIGKVTPSGLTRIRLGAVTDPAKVPRLVSPHFLTLPSKFLLSSPWAAPA